MTTLRDLLDHAVFEPAGPAPTQAIHRRARALRRRRRTSVTVCLAVVLALLSFAPLELPRRHAAPTQRPSVSQVRVGVLAPGTYSDPVLQPGIEFDVPTFLDIRASLVTSSSLVLVDDRRGIEVAIQHWTGVQATGQASTDGPVRIDPLPPHLLSWLVHLRGLRQVGGVQTAFLAGLPAHQLRLIAPHPPSSSGPPVDCWQASQCVPIAETPDNPVSLAQEQTMIVVVPDHPHGGLTLTVTAPSASFDDYATPIDALTSSFTLT